MLALSACGGPADETEVTNEATDTLAVPEDELTPTDNTISGSPLEPLDNEANALDAGNLSVDANVAGEAAVEANAQ